jgi:tetratricopeptide (TPR) repeat protein
LRHLNVLAFFSSLFTPPVVAQRIDDQKPSLDKLAPQLQNRLRRPSKGFPDARISVVRLRVPRKARQLYNKAITAILREQLLEAQQSLDQALGIESQFPEALALHGFIHATAQQWTSAEQRLQAAIQVDPGYVPAYVVLAGVYNSQSRFDDAHQTAQQAVSLGLTTWPIQYEIARAFIGKGEYEQALAVTDTALGTDHGPLIHLAKAHALMGLLRYKPVAAELRTFLHDQPSGDGSQDARALL